MKRYLTGIDWIINTLDYTAKAQSEIGNHSAVILELNTSLDHQALAAALNNFIQKFPILNGFPSRALNLCPYWKVPLVKQALPVQLQIISNQVRISAISNQVNRAFKDKREHLSFMLVEYEKRAFLAMAFDHRLLDAKGAEAFLHLFQQHYQDDEPRPLCLTCASQLNNWLIKFRSGKQLNRFLLDFTKESPRILSFNPQNEPCKFKVIHLNIEQSERLTGIAYARAGYLMFMPYALARCIQIMHRIFQEKNIPGSTYLIPVPIDVRTKEQAQKETLFNHFSFFLFKISADKADNLDELLAEIKLQMYTQVKNRIPEAIIQASFLLRIATLPLANFFLKLMSKKHFASFSFSYLNNAGQQNKFMQAQVQNIFHLPRTPKPPGVGIFFNQFENKLNITLSYFDDILTDLEATQITNRLQELGNAE